MTAPEPVVLTDGERCAIQDSSGAPGRLNRNHFEAVEQIIADRLAAERAAHEALREAVEAMADEWEGWSSRRSTPRIDAFRDAAEHLCAALTATVPTPPESAAKEGGL